MQKFGIFLWLLSCSLSGLTAFGQSHKSEVFVRGSEYLQVEVWRSDLLHFEMGLGGAEPRIWHTPSILPERRDATVDYVRGVTGTGDDFLETNDLRVLIPRRGLCLEVFEKRFHHRQLGRFCGQVVNKSGRQLKIEGGDVQHLFGLGQQLDDPDQDRGRRDDWVGRRRESPSPYGNFMKSFLGGAVGDTQIPILYALGPGRSGYGLYLDAVEKLVWDFEATPWRVATERSTVRGFLISGADLPSWRRGYMELTGKPLVPPRKMFGLWVSEYGFDNWAELEGKMSSLKRQNFPLDGFVLDLQWFGGVKAGAEDTPMGGLEWDRRQFPDPEGKLQKLKDQEQVGLVLIEESYVGRARLEHRELAAKGYLARDCQSCGPTYIDVNPWWGKGGMIDWSHPESGLFWHQWKRAPLIKMGVMGHWTDLGEPEMFQPWSSYFGFSDRGMQGHADVHNYFSFWWHQGIHDSYARYHPDRRPFIMSRSGAAGSQRFGTVMWSADIGSNMKSLAAHLRSQMHMSLSGIDYYGSDIGGFHRGGLDGNLDVLFTQWFANASLFDVPVRPHVENLCNCKETAPDRIGHQASNRENLKLRYQLTPYYYSLAHLAHESGEAMFPPLAYYFQEDLAARNLAHQKMIGPWLMAGIVAAYGQTTRGVYLPAGTWFNFHSGTRYDSQGGWIQSESLWQNGLFRLPLLVREGAIIPMASSLTQHLSANSGLAQEVRVFPSGHDTSFDLIEDDGESSGYLRNQLKKTRLTQGPVAGGLEVTIERAQGTYAGAPTARSWIIRLPGVRSVSQVSWQGRTLKGLSVKESPRLGTWRLEEGDLVVYTPSEPEQVAKTLRLELDSLQAISIH